MTRTASGYKRIIQYPFNSSNFSFRNPDLTDPHPSTDRLWSLVRNTFYAFFFFFYERA